MPFDNLPPELRQAIISEISPFDILAFSAVSRDCRRLCSERLQEISKLKPNVNRGELCEIAQGIKFYPLVREHPALPHFVTHFEWSEDLSRARWQSYKEQIIEAFESTPWCGRHWVIVEKCDSRDRSKSLQFDIPALILTLLPTLRSLVLNQPYGSDTDLAAFFRKLTIAMQNVQGVQEAQPRPITSLNWRSSSTIPTRRHSAADVPFLRLRKLKAIYKESERYNESWPAFVSAHPGIRELEIEGQSAFAVGELASCREFPMMANITKFSFADWTDNDESIYAAMDYRRKAFVCRLIRHMPQLEVFVGVFPAWDGGWNPLLREIKKEKRRSLKELALSCQGFIIESLFLDISPIRRLETVKRMELSLTLFIEFPESRSTHSPYEGFRTRLLLDHLPRSVEELILHIPGGRHWQWGPGSVESEEILEASQQVLAGFESRCANLVPLLKWMSIRYYQRTKWQHSWAKFLEYAASVCQQVGIEFSSTEIPPECKKDTEEWEPYRREIALPDDAYSYQRLTEGSAPLII